MNLHEYREFVDGITSNESKNTEDLLVRIENLNEKGVEVSRLLTAAVGLPGEVGEFSDIVKKILFQGKEMSDEVSEKLIKELGDITWYWIQGCIALGVDPYAVLQANMDKLSGRYKNKTFSVEESENRKQSDV